MLFRGSTALHRVGQANKAEIVSILLSYGADFKIRNSDQETPLQLSCLKDSLNAVKIFLSYLPKNYLSHACYYEGWSIPHYVVLGGTSLALEILKLCINNEINLAQQNRYGQTPLHVCASRNYINCAEELCKHYSVQQFVC